MPDTTRPKMNGSPRIAVRLTNWIGDALMNTPALVALRELYPDADIRVIGRSYVLPLFENNSHINGVIAYDKVSGRGRAKAFMAKARELRGYKFDIGISFQNAFEGAFLLRAAGCKRVVGYARDMRRFLLTDALPVSKDDLNIHETRYYRQLIEHLGAPKAEPAPYQLPLTDEEKARGEQILRQHTIDPKQPIVAVNPGATYGSAKRWYPERYAAVADLLAERFGAQIIVLGTEKERPMGIAIEENMRHTVVVLSGQTSLRELAAVLSWTNMLLTNDSGTMHVACTQQIPMVVMVGSTNPTTTSPWRTPYLIVREQVDCSPCLLRECPIDHRCMERLTVEKVLSGAEGFFEKWLG